MTGDEWTSKEFLEKVVMPKLDVIEAKLDHKAEAAALVLVDNRVTELERHGSREAAEAITRLTAHDSALDSLIAWRNRIIGALAALSVLSGIALTLAAIAAHLFK